MREKGEPEGDEEESSEKKAKRDTKRELEFESETWGPSITQKYSDSDKTPMARL